MLLILLLGFAGYRLLPIAAVAAGRTADHSSVGLAARRQRRNHGQFSRDATRTAIVPDFRLVGDDLHERAGRTSITCNSCSIAISMRRHRMCKRAQRGQWSFAQNFAESTHLRESESGRFSNLSLGVTSDTMPLSEVDRYADFLHCATAFKNSRRRLGGFAR